MHEEFQERKSPNNETSTVPRETDKKKKEREGDRKVLTSFTDVAGLKKGSSDVQRSNGNHFLHFGMVQDGTHTETLCIPQCKHLMVISIIMLP